MSARSRGRRWLCAALGGAPDVAPVRPTTWRPVLEMAAEQLLWPALWVAGRRRSWWSALPADARDLALSRCAAGAAVPELLLQRAADDNRARNRDLLEQLDLVTVALADDGIDTVPLKGAHALRAGWWPDPAARVLRDVDVLISARDANRAWACLARLGYQPLGDHDPDADHQLPAVHLPGRAGSIELHTALARGRWRNVVPAAAVLAAPRLDATTAVTHLVVGAQLHDEGHLLRRLPLRQLLELDAVARSTAGASVDWDRIRGTFLEAGSIGALDVFLQLAHQLLGTDVPVRGVAQTWRIVVALADHPWLADRWEPVAYAPRALATARMAQLYGPGPPWRSRFRHVVGGVHRRIDRLGDATPRRGRPGAAASTGIWYDEGRMPTFEPRTVLPDDLTDAVYVHVIGASVWTDPAPADADWGTHVVGLLDGVAWYAVDVPADVDPSDGAKLDLYGFHGRAGQEAWLAAGRAVQLVEWARTHRFCGRCATPTEPAPGERAMRCSSCGLSAFPRLAPAMITLVTRGDDGPDQEALLARGIQWKVPMYSCLAGFVEPGESLEGAVVREVKEEVGVTVDDVRYQSSQPWPFPHSLMCGFRARWAGGDIECDPTEIADAQWYRRDAMPTIPPGISIARRLIDDWVTEREPSGSPIERTKRHE